MSPSLWIRTSHQRSAQTSPIRPPTANPINTRSRRSSDLARSERARPRPAQLAPPQSAPDGSLGARTAFRPNQLSAASVSGWIRRRGLDSSRSSLVQRRAGTSCSSTARVVLAIPVPARYEQPTGSGQTLPFRQACGDVRGSDIGDSHRGQVGPAHMAKRDAYRAIDDGASSLFVQPTQVGRLQPLSVAAKSGEHRRRLLDRAASATSRSRASFRTRIQLASLSRRMRQVDSLSRLICATSRISPRVVPAPHPTSRAPTLARWICWVLQQTYGTQLSWRKLTASHPTSLGNLWGRKWGRR